jgi:hypothetical protein
MMNLGVFGIELMIMLSDLVHHCLIQTMVQHCIPCRPLLHPVIQSFHTRSYLFSTCYVRPTHVFILKPFYITTYTMAHGKGRRHMCLFAITVYLLCGMYGNMYAVQKDCDQDTIRALNEKIC